MLTGDKFSTALQVATACNLRHLTEKSDFYEIKGVLEEEVTFDGYPSTWSVKCEGLVTERMAGVLVLV